MLRAAAAVSLLLLAGCLSGPGGEGVQDLPQASVRPAEDAAAAPAQAPPPGATATAAPPRAGTAPPDAGAKAAGLATLAPGEVLEWAGRCPCPAYRFAVAGADGGAALDGWLEVRVRWDGAATPGLALRLSDAAGRSAVGERGFDDRLARLWSPVPGRHVVDLGGAGEFVATARLGSLAVPADGPLLPNLVEMVLEGPHVGACDAVEQAEQGAVRCLRFGNGVANPGHGPVQIRLTVEQAAQALAPLGGRFVQEVRHADGSVAAHPVGPADFHVAHGHWHYDGLAVFDLYAVDGRTGLRGERAASHGKAGFCFLDWDQMRENTTEPEERERAETDCLVPGLAGSWTNGISRGWYDFYEASLTDQYVDVAGLPAGLYELVATADPLGTLAELDETDNQSSLLLRLGAGGEPEVLEERAHYRVQDEDDH